MAIIKKAKSVIGKTLVFTNADVADSGFIFGLRTNADKSRYISKVSSKLSDQVAWLENYGNDNRQAYFIIKSEGHSIGTVRLYDPQDSSFCWGSWIILANGHHSAAIESALMVYSYGIDVLGFNGAHFDVRKENKSVVSFHERMGATRISETEEDIYYTINYKSIKDAQLKYKRFLDKVVDVEFYEYKPLPYLGAP
jgi:hypothetical protein